jgi:alkylation response protein AidB-like acyl-CoA dehydrogenase
MEYTADDRAFMEEVTQWFEQHTPPELKGDQFMFGTISVEQNIAWARTLNERGWAAVNWPKAHGGSDWSQARKHIFEQARADARAPMVYNMGVHLLGPVIYGFGTEEQKAYYLPRILNFDDWWCQGYSEPGAGSDLASLQTKAVSDGDDYIVNGSKIWTTYAHEANRIFCLVRTSSEGKKQEGISFLLIDMNTPGVEVRPIRTIDGRHHLNEVFFTDVRVPKTNRVGDEGQGWSIAKYLLTHERTNIARIPLTSVELAKLKELAKTPAGNGTVADVENIAQKIAEVEIGLKCLTFTNDQMLAQTDAGKAPGAESSMLKIRGTQVQQRIAELNVEVAGVLGYVWPAEDSLDPDPFMRAAPNYAFSRAATIYGGSTEVQYNVMAKALLGL